MLRVNTGATGVTSCEVDVRRLQRVLFEEGIDLGEQDHAKVLLAKPTASLEDCAKHEVDT